MELPVTLHLLLQLAICSSQVRAGTSTDSLHMAAHNMAMLAMALLDAHTGCSMAAEGGPNTKW